MDRRVLDTIRFRSIQSTILETTLLSGILNIFARIMISERFSLVLFNICPFFWMTQTGKCKMKISWNIETIGYLENSKNVHCLSKIHRILRTSIIRYSNNKSQKCHTFTNWITEFKYVLTWPFDHSWGVWLIRFEFWKILQDFFQTYRFVPYDIM